MIRSASLMGLLRACLAGAFVSFGALLLLLFFFFPDAAAAKTFLGLLLAGFIFREIFSGRGGGVGVETGGDPVVGTMIVSAPLLP